MTTPYYHMLSSPPMHCMREWAAKRGLVWPGMIEWEKLKASQRVAELKRQEAESEDDPDDE